VCYEALLEFRARNNPGKLPFPITTAEYMEEGAPMQPEPTPSLPGGWQTRLRLICKPPVIRQALLAAGMVGTLLVGLNQGDLLLSGQVTGRVLVKALLTPFIPFCVTMLGAFLNTGTAARIEDLRPGRAVVRRSVVIALGVGSTIIALNQGDVLLAGALTPLVLVKVLVTPCVPFCVSLFGAYAAYRSAWNEQQKAARIS
jgi:hypothetical protein